MKKMAKMALYLMAGGIVLHTAIELIKNRDKNILAKAKKLFDEIVSGEPETESK